MRCADGKVEIRVGDCRDLLKEMPDESVQCVVTSPPYFGLRDYGVDGQLGLEPTPDEFVAAMVEVFREVRRVQRTDGTLWLNLGDSYAGGGNGGGGSFAKDGIRCALPGTDKNKATRHGKRGAVDGLKSKDLIGIPWRVAFALRADGWYLRQDIVWSKPNPMPESVRDRCTKAHEYLFMLTKAPRYFYDQDAIRENMAPSSIARLAQNVEAQAGSERVPGKTNGPMKAVARKSKSKDGQQSMTRNKRSVWTVTTQPFKEAHFATYPPALIEPCILAGCPKGGTVLDPFGGAGTTGLVAARHNRRAVLLELNPEYAAIAHRRISDEWREPVAVETDEPLGGLFSETGP